MEHTDVIVVGGGPGGSTCARRLVEHGASVRVLDAAVFPRDKVCAGWITPQVVDALRLDVEEYRAGRTWQDLTAFRVGSVGSSDPLLVDYRSRVSAGIRRCEFDIYLLHRCGAQLQTGTAVRSIRRDGGVWVVDERWSAPMLVGAAGSNCPVSRLLNGPMTRSGPRIVAREAEYVMDTAARDMCRVQSGVAELYFTADLLGYGWCVRKRDVMNIGIGRLGNHLPRTEVEAFSAFARDTRGVLAPSLDSWHGHAYLAGAARGHRRSADGVVLVGDAAGLASDRSGEGIGPAIDAAIMAADAIARAGGNYSADRLSPYDEGVARRWQQPDALASVARLIPPGVVRTLAAPLLRNRAFVQGVVLDRWFLHAHERVAPAAAA